MNEEDPYEHYAQPIKKASVVMDNSHPTSRFFTHSVPLDMDDVARDFDKPVQEAGIAAKSSIIVRVGSLGLGAGTGSYRVRELMHRVAEPIGVHVRADVNLTDIEATCTDQHERVTEVVDLPTTGVNTERIWILEHFIDWINVNLGQPSLYHSQGKASQQFVETLSEVKPDESILEGIKHNQEKSNDTTRKPSRTPNDLASFINQTHASQDHPLTVRQIHECLDLIKNRKPLYAPWFAALASAVACASFTFLLGGNIYDMFGAFIGAGLGHWVRRRMLMKHLNQFVVTFIAVALGALACIASLQFLSFFDPHAIGHNTAYIGSVLFVIPGFPLITGCLDIAKIDFPSGLQRIAYTLAIILMGTLAGWMVASLVQLNPQGFMPYEMDLYLKTLLRMITAFAGVWGFSVLFNSPQRMCLIAGVIGAITDTLRLTMVDFGIAAEIGAFTGALLAGLLASAWRSSVRRGHLPKYWDYPRITLTVPSIVIMVPGLYMYRAMFYLGQFQTLPALDWAFRAFMVIICMPLGLAVARVITDKNWRYDV